MKNDGEVCRTAARRAVLSSIPHGCAKRDRTTKLRHYARGGIGQYVVLDLHERMAEEYLEPDPTAGTYATRLTHPTGGTLRLRLAGQDDLAVAVAELFPLP